MTLPANYAYWQNAGDWWVEEYRRRRRLPFYALQELVLTAVLEANAPARVLEFGCGVGRHLSYVSTIPGIEVHGADQSPTMLAGVPQWVSDPATAARTHLIEPTGTLPFADDSFDLVYTAEVLLHVAPADIAGRLAELARIARHAVIHLEPALDYHLYADAHDGCWSHDLVRIYADLGVTARRIGRPLDAQELIVAEIDPRYRLAAPGPALLRQMLEVETRLDGHLAESIGSRDCGIAAGSDGATSTAADCHHRAGQQ